MRKILSINSSNNVLHLTLHLILLLLLLTPSHAFLLHPTTRRRQHAPTHLLASTTTSSSSQPLLTQAEIDTCAASFGIELRLTTLGPFYRIIARMKEDAETAEPIGYTSGFVAPLFGGLVHLDTMQVRRRYWKQLEGKKKFPFGCGVLLGATAMRHAYDCGCRKAELLAIYDDEKTHRLLKGFYKLAGFVVVKEVTNDVLCIPDLLVWGGVGTRMDMKVEDFLRKWRQMIVEGGKEMK